jgi:hypothetical protein
MSNPRSSTGAHDGINESFDVEATRRSGLIKSEGKGYSPDLLRHSAGLLMSGLSRVNFFGFASTKNGVP